MFTIKLHSITIFGLNAQRYGRVLESHDNIPLSMKGQLPR